MAVPRYVSVGVGAIVMRGERVLLIRRKTPHGLGTWSTPGGHLDFGESPEVCAVRELEEEAGVTMDAVEFVALTNDVFEDTGKHYVTIWMRGRYTGGEASVKSEYEVAEVGWFRWDQLPEPLFVCFHNLIAGRSYPAFSPAKGA